MKKRVLTSWLLLNVVFAGAHAWAQEGGGGYRFQPPTPPPLDGADFDDSDDELDMGDGGYRPPVPPAPPQNGGGNGFPPPPGMNDSRPPAPSGGGGFDLTTSPGKFRFKVVEGEFYEKGKKRTRGHQTRVTGSKAE